jgi:hypothetical protein
MSIPQAFDDKIREHLKNLEENIIETIEKQFGDELASKDKTIMFL